MSVLTSESKCMKPDGTQSGLITTGLRFSVDREQLALFDTKFPITKLGRMIESIPRTKASEIIQLAPYKSQVVFVSLQCDIHALKETGSGTDAIGPKVPQT
jgi:hypothetical protein